MIHLIVLLLITYLIYQSYIYFAVCYSNINNGKKLDKSHKKGCFVGYDKYSTSYLVYYHAELSTLLEDFKIIW